MYWVLSAFWGEKETRPSGSPPKSQNVGCMLQLFPSPGRNQELGIFTSLFHVEQRDSTERVCVSSHHCLCSQWHAIRTFYCQNLDSGKKECSPLGRYTPPLHQTSEPCTCVSAFSFSPRRDAGSGSFHWLLQLRCGEGLRWVNAVDFPAGFDVLVSPLPLV